MKKFILFCFLLTSLFTKAQVLNPGFENVTTGIPDDWNVGFYSTYYIHDTSDAHTGNHAAYIKGFGGRSYTIQGAVLGQFTITSQPVSMTGWYKCGLQPGDSLVFTPYVYKSTFQSTATQNYSYTTSSTAVYKQFVNNFSYPAGDTTAGSIFVSVYLSGQSTDSAGVVIPQTGTWAIIDDISLNYPVITGIKTIEGVSSVEQIYPQPAGDAAYCIYSLSQTTVCDLQLFDITGKAVKTVLSNEKQTPGRYKAEFDLEGLGAGVYLVKLKAGDETHVSKLIKN